MTVEKTARDLRYLAEHFEQKDWEYTRDLGPLKSIRYNYPEDTLWGRIKDSWEWMFTSKGSTILRMLLCDGETMLGARWRQARYALKRDKHLPDGVLDGGGVLVYWEETAEYLQYVQPSVGSIVANFMEEFPDHPYAVQLAEEMERIQKDYSERIVAQKIGAA